MSIILKGIDLPQKLYTDIRIYKDGRIKKIIGENTIISYGENVQAIQIPKGHGRIGDLDEVRRKGVDDGYDFYVSWTDIDNEPTILEAEE